MLSDLADQKDVFLFISMLFLTFIQRARRRCRRLVPPKFLLQRQLYPVLGERCVTSKKRLRGRLRLLANRRSSAKVLMTEPDIAHVVKEIWGARVVYIFAFHVE